MLNIGLPEFGLIAVLALFFVGPERLPGLARTAATWIAKFRTEAGKSLSELRSVAELEDVAAEVSTLRKELRATRSELTRSLRQPAATVRDTVKQVSTGGPTDMSSSGTVPAVPPMDPEAT